LAQENISTFNIEHNRSKKSPNKVADFDVGGGYKPWWIAQHLVDTEKFQQYVDFARLRLITWCRVPGRWEKRIGGLESVDQHVAVLGGLSDRDSEILLRGALAGVPNTGPAEVDRMRKALAKWRHRHALGRGCTLAERGSVDCRTFG
jgi:hypothetical protein